MLSHFYYSDFRDGKLLTNDMGRYSFLTQSEFDLFVTDQLDHESEKYHELLKNGFCIADSVEHYARFFEDQFRDGNRYLFDSTSLFIFAVTNKCNHNCVYCQANGNSSPCSMTEFTAEQALKQIAKSPAHEIVIEFQGGEPLNNFPIIRYIVQNAPSLMPDKLIRFTLVSNLSLLSPEIAVFLRDYHVSVSTSLDGPKVLHDKNRPMAGGQSSFDRMLRGKHLLEEIGVKVGAIQTPTAQSLSMPEEILDTYVQYGFSSVFLRPLTRLGAAARSWNKIGYSPEAYLSFYKAALEKIIDLRKHGIHIIEIYASLFLSKILRGNALNYMELRSPCGAGLGQVAITSNGNVYTCDEGRMLGEAGDHAFLLGNVLTSGYNEWMDSPVCKAACSASLLDTLPGCCDCVYKPYCGVCPVVNYAVNGSITQVSKDRCRIHRGLLGLLFNYLYEGDSMVLEMFDEWSDQA